MSRRLPSQPPVLPGFSYIRVLGSGGFADVFLFEQNMPRRQVAVKVMLSEVVNDQVRQMFQAEANLMAQLSSHPSILTVYQASVSSDGRPYLVMELCSSSLSQRYRAESIPVADVLRVAVKVGSAIETAHRAGVLHRDIKPSNILLTAYGHPVLSDFGIAATLSESDNQQSVGLSIPWSAPEVLMDETAGTIASEVWSFAATVYSLIAGRSPFEVPGQANGSTDLISRINRAKPQPMGRTDVPATLERIIARGMSRKPGARHASVLELILELQSVETELGFAQTPSEVAVDEWAVATVSDLDDRTHVRAVSGSAVSASSRRRARRARLGNDHYDAIGTVVRESGGRGSAATTTPRSPAARLLTWAIVISSVLVVALGATAIAVLIRANSDDIPIVSNISAAQTETTIQYSWGDPGLADGDSYQIDVDGGGRSVQNQAAFVVDADSGDVVCLSVRVVRDGRLGEASNPKCVEFTG